jgi:diguanylate cyclase (GGDEF)-like protein
VAVLAAFRPLAPGAAPWLRLVSLTLLAAGVVAAALLATLRGRGVAEPVALYAFLLLAIDGFGQLVGPIGWPVWPAFALILAAIAVAEPPWVAFGAAALAAALAVVDAASSGFGQWKAAVAASLGYAALVFAVHFAQRLEKSRLASARAELARLQHGIDELEDSGPGAHAPAGPAALALRDASGDARRARRMDRAAELDEALGRVVSLARRSVNAHAVCYFDFNREQERAFLRAADGPPSLIANTVAPLRSDPFGFVLDRGQTFYATDFSRLLWRLPYYRGEVKVGTLVAVPVRLSGIVRGVLVADRLEIQSLTGEEQPLLGAFAELAAETIRSTTAADQREEMGTEMKAIYEVSRQMAGLSEVDKVRARLLAAARELLSPEGGAVVTVNANGTAYSVDNSLGWVKDGEFEGRQVAMLEETWTAWLLKQEDPTLLLDDLHGGGKPKPILVLDEGSGRAESILAVALRSGNEVLGAMVLTGKRGTFDSNGQRVLTVLANQAAGALRVGQLYQQARDTALRDGLTGLYNRRAFDEHLKQAIGREGRQEGGKFALLLLDIDHFKKLNDTYGHPAGDAALRHTATLLHGHLRTADQDARFGGEEFAVIVAGAGEAGALNMAERIRHGIEKGQVIFDGARLSVTVSIGVAVWPRDGLSGPELVVAADRALYAAKQGGRNRVVVATAVPAS